MNLSMLDREQLEAIVLDPSALDCEALRCRDAALPAERGGLVRERRLRHVLAAAHELLVRIANQAIVGRCLLNSSDLLKEYLTVHFAGAERELFVAVFLDSRKRVIAAETLFAGTLEQTRIYPREIVRHALHHNASAVVFAHNHPSGVAEPSVEDARATSMLQEALALISVEVVDHIVVAGNNTVSMADRGLL
ncbi:MAG TPA: DNA repair protein RadC [Burkholderiaceae bacterium]|nr:DNA repair protein RadC [Burkholderiaceae bacterium]